METASPSGGAVCALVSYQTSDARFLAANGGDATLALCAGIHPRVVCERLPHATIAITLDTYSHAIPAMQEEEGEALIAGLVFAGA